MIKIRIIDLLNKIANGEEVHLKTKLNGKEVVVNYYNDRDFSTSTGPELLTIVDIIKSLNDEVEILEEEKKIPEKSNIDFNTKLPVSGCSENEAFMMTCISHLGKTIDSLIDYLKSKGE